MELLLHTVSFTRTVACHAYHISSSVARRW